jgi:acetylornithine deacetylase/succinyl-diaminopimelate desuccinylase-like protein
MPAPAAVRTAAAAQFEPAIERLSRYIRIPAVSCDPKHFADVDRLAAVVAADLNQLGLQAEVLALPPREDGKPTLPAVAASWLHAGPQAPTILIYGHLDLQPVDGGDGWRTPPHEPVRVGDRLYGRGSSDDMGGWVSHVAAIEAWLQTEGTLPCNLRLFIEGEEECGSNNLERYMDAYPEVFAADAMILTDCENPSTDVPGLTVSLRGVFEVVVRVRALEADVHSGLWGNMVPDPATALMTLIARLVDHNGRLRVGLCQQPQSRVDAAARVPVPDEVIVRGAHLLPGVQPLPTDGRSAAEWLWLQPAITVVTTTLPPPERKKNAIRAAAEAVLSIRLGPGQTPDEVLTAVQGELLRDPPGGVLVTATQERGFGMGWYYEPAGPAFDAVDRAYVSAWGHKPVRVGVGGSIPFVAIFAKRFSDLPLILNGVMDPESTAHGPNESLHLGVFAKAIAANVELYAELAQALPRK